MSDDDKRDEELDSPPDESSKEDVPPTAADTEEADALEADVPEDDFPEDLDAEGDEDEEEDYEGLDDADVKDLLRGAMRPPPGAVAPRILPGVQQKLRVRSRGKFYGDGWSTAQSPRSTYLITSVLMLLLVLVVFAVLVPWSGAAVP